jgi:molybdopterin biosynthesis enzyme MoaB
MSVVITTGGTGMSLAEIHEVLAEDEMFELLEEATESCFAAVE